MTKKKTVILIRETPYQSVLSDLFTFIMITSLIGIGVYLESNAMQWVGAFMAFIGILTVATNSGKKVVLTVAQARVRLDEIERGEV